jgi:transcription factor SFP1
VKDRNQPPSIQIPFNPQMNPPDPEPPLQLQQQPQYSTPFDTDDMDLGLDYDSAASPPPLSTAPTSTVTSRAPSPSPSPSGTQRPALNISLNGVGFPFREATPLSGRAPAPFSAYARYNAEYNSPGAVTPQDVAEYAPDPTAIAPALVFATGEELQGDSRGSSPSTSTSAPPTASTSSIPSVSAGGKVQKASKRSPPPTFTSVSAPPSRGATPGAMLPTPPASAGATPSPATILLPHKPFRCPKPNCSKSYKQANGLKYHMTHGSCNYGPAKDLEAVRALLERKRANAAVPEEEAEDASGSNTPVPAANGSNELSQAELNEVEARVRPFACGVGDCTRRYKNMNGLRYHYQHSGDHGAVGLGQLAGGVHACLQQRQGTNTSTTPSTTASTSAAAGIGAGAAKGKSPSSYAWGSTLLPHIQAVATTTAKGKTEATPFTPPTTSVNSNSAPATPAVSATSTTTFATAAFTSAQTPEYLAHLQRAQFAQYQQWYAQAQAVPQVQQPQQQVDVQMG